MNVVFADASRATVKLLNEFNCEIVTPQDHMCCGAPQDDQGLKDVMRRMARHNIEAFEHLGATSTRSWRTAQACSGFLKEYRHVFHTDPAWAARAERFAGKVRDITEWLDQIMPADLPLRRGETRAPEGRRSGFIQNCYDKKFIYFFVGYIVGRS